MKNKASTINHELRNNYASSNINVADIYLEAIYRLQEAYGVARTSMIAKEIGVKPGTVTKMLTKLVREGLIEYSPREGITLSKLGYYRATQLVRKQRILEAYLHSKEKIDPYDACIKSRKIVLEIPDYLVDKIDASLGYPSMCPHGNPIPGRHSRIKNSIPLLSVKPKGAYKIVRIKGIPRFCIGFLKENSIYVGFKLYVNYVGKGHVEADIYSGNVLKRKQLQIPHHIANIIMVEA